MRRSKTRRRLHRQDGGFTLVELVVTMSVAGVLMALTAFGWSAYLRATQQRDTAQQVLSVLRNAQQRSLAEAVSYCVSFEPRALDLHRYSCADADVATTTVSDAAQVSLDDASFLQPDGSQRSTLTFLPRGAATKGSVRVVRDGSAKVYTINVEGLTGRVSLAG